MVDFDSGIIQSHLFLHLLLHESKNFTLYLILDMYIIMSLHFPSPFSSYFCSQFLQTLIKKKNGISRIETSKVVDFKLKMVIINQSQPSVASC